MANEQSVYEIEDVNDLFALGQLGRRGQFLDQSQIERKRGPIRLNQCPGVAQEVDAVFDTQICQRSEQQTPGRPVIFDAIISGAIDI